MTEWYYAKGGQQSGPVTFEKLKDLAHSGGLDAAKDLVWTAAMPDWKPAGQVHGLFIVQESPVSAPVAADPSNPYAAPQSAWVEPVAAAGSTLREIIPGSEPLDPVACVKRGFELTKRQFVNILLVGLVYFGLIMVPSLIIGMIQGVSAAASSHGTQSAGQMSAGASAFLGLFQLASKIFSIFLGLGLTRIGLNFVSGKAVTVGMLFGEGGKLLRAIGASIIFGLMVVVGILLLVVPGIYLALRYGQFMNGIVDRDLGVMDSFSYSAALTTNNKLQLFVLGIFCMLIAIAGMLACGVGMIFAGPVAWLGSLVAYRWMQYGSKAVLDHPGTVTPVLTGV